MPFRRSDATVTPEVGIQVQSQKERNQIPLTIFHYPISVALYFTDNSLLALILSGNQEVNLRAAQHEARVKKASKLICDPTEVEEDFLSNVFVVCANTYREIVFIQSLARVSIASFASKLADCSTKAFERAKYVTDYFVVPTQNSSKVLD